MQRRGSCADNPRYINGVSIWEQLIGKNVTLVMSIYGSNYRIEHDILVEWISQNKPYLNTVSWKRDGYYFRGKPSAAMMEFLRAYRE